MHFHTAHKYCMYMYLSVFICLVGQFWQCSMVVNWAMNSHMLLAMDSFANIDGKYLSIILVSMNYNNSEFIILLLCVIVEFLINYL